MASADCWLCCGEDGVDVEDTFQDCAVIQDLSPSTPHQCLGPACALGPQPARKAVPSAEEDAEYHLQLQDQERIAWAALNHLPGPQTHARPTQGAAPGACPCPCPPCDGSKAAVVTPTLRAAAVDWMVDAAWQLMLTNDTLFLAVQLLDRVLASAGVPSPNSTAQLQLLSLTCLWTASKHETSATPRAQRFLEVLLPPSAAPPETRAALKAEMVGLERVLLRAVDHRLGLPTVKTFLRRALARAPPPLSQPRAYFLAGYLSELALLDAALLAALPSSVAAGCYVVAAALADGAPPAAGDVLDATGYVPSALGAVTERLLQLHCAVSANPRHCAVWAKYCTPDLMKVALLQPTFCAVAAAAAVVASAAATLEPEASHRAKASPSPPPTPAAAPASPYVAASSPSSSCGAGDDPLTLCPAPPPALHRPAHAS